jgi:hypothetical protein
MSGEKERKVFIPRDGEICVEIEGELTDSQNQINLWILRDRKSNGLIEMNNIFLI